MVTQIKERLLAELESLPDHRVADVIDYIQFLQYQEQYLHGVKGMAANIDDNDPMRQFIGGIEHGHLAQNIDEDIYTS